MHAVENHLASDRSRSGSHGDQGDFPNPPAPPPRLCVITMALNNTMSPKTLDGVLRTPHMSSSKPYWPRSLGMRDDLSLRSTLTSTCSSLITKLVNSTGKWQDER